MVVGATAPPWAASLRAGAESLTVTRHFTSESGTRPSTPYAATVRPLVPRQTTDYLRGEEIYKRAVCVLYCLHGIQ